MLQGVGMSKTLNRSRDNAEVLRLMTLMTGDEKHAPAATSTLDVIRVLYERVLAVSPGTVDDPVRDRFMLSKGHGPMAYYAVLAERGFFPVSWLEGWAGYDSRTPDMVSWILRVRGAV